MQTTACSQFLGLHLIPAAGHWVQQEQPRAVAELLIHFLRELGLGS
jgi:pimeloyl-ACP methyl ester carboxylesterase